MVQACSLAEDKLCKQDWNAKNVTAFLNNHGIKQLLIDKLLDRYKPLIENTLDDPQEDRLYLPPIWEDPYKIYHWIDAPMHLLFLGVVKKNQLRNRQVGYTFWKETSYSENFRGNIALYFES